MRGTDRSLKWWTFGGLRANAALGAWLRSRLFHAVAPNNLSIRVPSDSTSGELESALRDLRAAPAETLLPDVSTKALEGLKFTACLPEALAKHVLQMRMMDVAAVERVQAEPARYRTETAQGQRFRPAARGFWLLTLNTVAEQNLVTDDALRAACEDVSRPENWEPQRHVWMGQLAETIQWVRDTGEPGRRSSSFQVRLWEDNHVAAIGQGTSRCTGAR